MDVPWETVSNNKLDGLTRNMLVTNDSFTWSSRSRKRENEPYDVEIRSSDSNRVKKFKLLKWMMEFKKSWMLTNKTEKTIQALTSFVISSGISNPRPT